MNSNYNESINNLIIELVKLDIFNINNNNLNINKDLIDEEIVPKNNVKFPWFINSKLPYSFDSFYCIFLIIYILFLIKWIIQMKIYI